MATSVRLLGEVRVLDGQRWRGPPLDKRVGLLGYLACRGTWVEREKLAYLFWPDGSDQQARTNLRGLLARSKELPFARDLEVDATRLRWRVRCDVLDFRQAIAGRLWAAAVSSYGGELFARASFDGAGGFTSWLERERGDLEAAYRDAAFERVRELAAAGGMDDAVGLVDGLLRRDPLDEESARLSMHLLAEEGDLDRALRVYRAFSDRLADELGMAPTSSTEALARALEARLGDAHAAAGGGASLLRSRSPGGDAAGPAAGLTGRTLPTPLTPFVGRDAELSELARLLADPDRRLVTVIGEGGVGKTRLALQAARHFGDRYRAGAFFVSLDSVTSVAALPAAMAGALGIDLRGRGDALTQVTRALASLHLLVVLDNFEQLLEGSGLLLELLQACPHLVLLVTSREPLGVSGEWSFPLTGFSFPDTSVEGAGIVTLDDARSHSAIEFFAERCKQVQPAFALTQASLPEVVRICRVVDGLPLGLELAAVWARVMPIGEIAQEIQENLDFLSRRAHGVPERHRSIRAAFDHSWRLLAPKEREVLRKLAVFRNGFRRDAAAYVAGASIVILAGLVDKSLLRVSPAGRYDRHPLLHQYTSEKLAEHPADEQQAKDRHLGYFMALAEGSSGREGPDTAARLTRMEEEHDDLRAALEHAESTGRVEAGQRFALAMLLFWRSHLSEGRAWFERMLALSSDGTPTRAQLLEGAGAVALLQGDYEAARSYLEEALVMARARAEGGAGSGALRNLGVAAKIQGNYEEARAFLQEVVAATPSDERRPAFALNNLGDIARIHGEHGEAHALHEEALAIGRERRDPRTIAQSLNGLGRIARDRGDLVAARDRFAESLAVARASKNSAGVAASLDCLGHLARVERDAGAARSLYAESLRIKWESGSELYVAASLEAVAALLAITGDDGRAARLWGAAEILRESRSTPLPPDERARQEQEVAAARDRHGDERFCEAWRQGRGLDVVDAVAAAMEALRAS